MPCFLGGTSRVADVQRLIGLAGKPGHLDLERPPQARDMAGPVLDGVGAQSISTLSWPPAVTLAF